MPENESAIRTGQEPVGARSVLALAFLSLLWSLNSVAIKLIVPGIQPFTAAFLRFAPSVLLIGLFLAVKKIGVRVTIRQFFAISAVGLLMGFQIVTFNLGAVYTTGGRVTLFIFSYPFYVSLIAPIFIKDEKLSFRVIGGSAIALAGLVLALSGRLSGGSLVGDLIELASGIVLSFQVVVNKIVMRFVDKWKITFWQFVVAGFVFLAGALVSESFDPASVRPDAWWALLFQIVVISVIGILAWQFLLAKHSASSVSVIFFSTPIAGIVVTMLFLGETFDPNLVSGSLLVAAGIALVYVRRKT